MLDLDPTIVRAKLSFLLHAPEPHSKPAIELFELVYARRERSPEVTCHSPHDRIDSFDLSAVKVVIANG
jgi:hypothetical protein